MVINATKLLRHIVSGSCMATEKKRFSSGSSDSLETHFDITNLETFFKNLGLEMCSRQLYKGSSKSVCDNSSIDSAR